MGKAQSKRSVDITTAEGTSVTSIGKKSGDVEEVLPAGKLEKIEDGAVIIGSEGGGDQLSNLKGEATTQAASVDSENVRKDGSEEAENEKDLTTEKSVAITNNESVTPSVENGGEPKPPEGADEDVKNGGGCEEEDVAEIVTPLANADESASAAKKSKKKKWSFRSISFGKKDKQKPAKGDDNAATVVAAGASSPTDEQQAIVNNDNEQLKVNDNSNGETKEVSESNGCAVESEKDNVESTVATATASPTEGRSELPAVAEVPIHQNGNVVPEEEKQQQTQHEVNNDQQQKQSTPVVTSTIEEFDEGIAAITAAAASLTIASPQQQEPVVNVATTNGSTSDHNGEVESTNNVGVHHATDNKQHQQEDSALPAAIEENIPSVVANGGSDDASQQNNGNGSAANGDDDVSPPGEEAEAETAVEQQHHMEPKMEVTATNSTVESILFSTSTTTTTNTNTSFAINSPEQKDNSFTAVVDSISPPHSTIDPPTSITANSDEQKPELIELRRTTIEIVTTNTDDPEQAEPEKSCEMQESMDDVSSLSSALKDDEINANNDQDNISLPENETENEILHQAESPEMILPPPLPNSPPPSNVSVFAFGQQTDNNDDESVVVVAAVPEPVISRADSNESTGEIEKTPCPFNNIELTSTSQDREDNAALMTEQIIEQANEQQQEQREEESGNVIETVVCVPQQLSNVGDEEHAISVEGSAAVIHNTDNDNDKMNVNANKSNDDDNNDIKKTEEIQNHPYCGESNDELKENGNSISSTGEKETITVITANDGGDADAEFNQHENCVSNDVIEHNKDIQLHSDNEVNNVEQATNVCVCIEEKEDKEEEEAEQQQQLHKPQQKNGSSEEYKNESENEVNDLSQQSKIITAAVIESGENKDGDEIVEIEFSKKEMPTAQELKENAAATDIIQQDLPVTCE